MLTRLVWTENQDGRLHRKSHYFLKTHIMEHLRSYRWVVEQSLVQELEAFGAAIAGEPTELATGYDGMRAVEIAQSVSTESLGR
jgi:hypothetical protein